MSSYREISHCRVGNDSHLVSVLNLGYQALTGAKGNVTLQFCGLTAKDIPAIAEVNTEKFGRVTPGTHIPIISEAEARAMSRIISWCCHGTSRMASCVGKKNIWRAGASLYFRSRKSRSSKEPVQ